MFKTDRKLLLFLATAVIEIGAGLCLLILPALSLSLLLGLEKPASEVQFVGRVAGSALLALGVASWIMRGEQAGSGPYGFVIGMSVYNTAAAVLFAYAGIGLKMTGPLLWPVVALHAGMANWCLSTWHAEPARSPVSMDR